MCILTSELVFDRWFEKLAVYLDVNLIKVETLQSCLSVSIRNEVSY